MDEEYELRKILIGNDMHCYELVSAFDERSRIEDWSTDPKRKATLAKLLKQLQKIKEYGVRASCEANKLRLIDAGSNLYEVKGFDGVNREMTCCAVQDKYGSVEIVLLFAFRGHQGSNKNKGSDIKKGKRLSRIAYRLLLDKE